MKICVITLLNVINYGSVLQTYATQCILEKMGYKVEFINYIRQDQTLKKQVAKQLKEIPNKQFIKKIYNAIIGIPKRQIQISRTFKKFLKENINMTAKQYQGNTELKKDVPEADIYCTGSDQMWNSKWNNGIEHAFFLDFVKDKPKCSFSTSIGMTEFEESQLDETLELLNKYEFITVREKSAKELLERYNIDSTVVLDPTLMVSDSFWRDFAKKSKYNKTTKKYLLVYKLHNSHNDINFDNYVKETAKELNLQVKVLSYGVPRKKVFDEYIGLTAIEDYVALFENAQYVITDSFHATSFCINLGKQFTCIYPNRFSTRMQNILELCGLTSRKLKSNTDPICKEKIDYKLPQKKLKEYREKSLQIIEENLKKLSK